MFSHGWFMNRKELKKSARLVLKKHYFILVFACLMASFLGVDFSSSFLNTDKISPKQLFNEFTQVVQVSTIIEPENFIDIINQEIEDNKAASSGTSFARNKGLLAKMVNGTCDGLLFYRALQAINSFVNSERMALRIFVLIFMLLYFLLWFLITNPFSVSFRRIFLEARTYKKVDYQKFAYLFYNKCLFNVAIAQALRGLYLFLWAFTIVGLPIAYYRYKMLSYILAENPSIKPLVALKLSKEMMRGHKWEAFKLDISFLPWYLISSFSFGILSILFVNPYKIATISEYYVYLRELAYNKGIENVNLLNDIYLYEIADASLVNEKYNDLIMQYNKGLDGDDYDLDADLWLASAIDNLRKQKGESFNENDYKESTGIFKWFEDNLGLSFRNARYNRLKQSLSLTFAAVDDYNKIKNGEIYPERLSSLPYKERRMKADYMRMYTMFSIVIIFFVGSVIGWTWEGMLHLIQKGSFVNRGALNGPWIPIYGVGAVVSISLGYRFRAKPIKEFVFIVIVSGIIEYATSYVMELTTGLRWWSYNGYYLNLNGRICLEGLLIFGIGGCAVVYWLIPYLEGVLKKLNSKYVSIVVILLAILFIIDVFYSHFHPNMGAGITHKVVAMIRENGTFLQ